MGRLRKGADLQAGNLSKEMLERKREEDRLATASRTFIKSKRKIPDGLIDERAVSEYKRVRKLLENIDVICDLDIVNLVNYCNAFSNHRRAVEEMKDQGYVLEKETQYGIQKYKNPLINVEKDYADEMRKFAALCGMSIDSRLKAASIKMAEERDDIDRRFDGI